MKAELITTKPIDIEIKGITLLSIEEYEAYKEHIKSVNYWWWLRSPGYDSFLAAIVNSDSSVYNFGYSVDYDRDAVRPALIFSRDSSNLNIGDILIIAGYEWTVISDNLIHCNDSIGKCPFRKYWKAPDANIYEASDVKKFVEKWATEKGILGKASIRNEQND